MLTVFYIFGWTDIVGVIGTLFMSLVIDFILTGILAFKYYRKAGIIPTKNTLKWFVIIAAILASGFTAILSFVIIISSTELMNLATFILIIIVIYFAMLITIFFMLLVFMFVGFGMVGVLVALVRAFTPEILLHISRITSNISDSANKEGMQKHTEYYILNWVFNIPKALDTKTLKIIGGKPRGWFPWKSLNRAMIWQILFGSVIIVYISLNPLYLKSELDFQNLFSIATNFTLVVPFIILPWFIYLRLDARISGPVKDYKLYSGIVYRMYRTFFTLGTIIIILRIGFERVNINDVIFALLMYYIFFILTIFLLTFVYFNYFENSVAWVVAKRYGKIKDR